MMNRAIFYTCGVINALFVLFHLVLAYGINRLTSLPPDVQALLQALNIGGVLMIAFLAVAFLACQKDLFTRLGPVAILLGALVYLTRIIEEFVLFPHPRPVIAIVCLVTGACHLLALRPVRAAA